MRERAEPTRERSANPSGEELEALARLAGAKNRELRREALATMRSWIEQGAAPEQFLPLAAPLIGDSDDRCRWQGAIVVGESISDHPEMVWPVIVEYGASEDEDLRSAVATVLLEHIVEMHFEWAYPRLKAVLREGHPQFVDTLRRCWSTLTDDQERRIANLIRQAKRGRARIR
jgi:hypothetical protein